MVAFEIGPGAVAAALGTGRWGQRHRQYPGRSALEEIKHRVG